MSLKHVLINARDLPDAWFQSVDLTIQNGRQWTVQHGSFVGCKRWELDYVTIHINYPGMRPLVPEMPAHLAHVPVPATMEYVEEYLPYLMTNQPLKENEQYTYGERIEPQMEAIIRRYREHGFGSNQECIAVARPEDINLDDPPCLRHIDTRIGNHMLHFFVYFRSNDLWNGFPVNLAAIRLMQEYMADSIGVEAGEIVYASKGLHLYDHVWKLAADRVGERI
jgi:thymidylate synthase